MSSRYTNTKAIEEISEHIVSYSLKNTGSAGESKGHHQIFKASTRRVDSSFPFASFSDCDHIMIHVSDMQLCEHCGTMVMLKSRADQRQRVIVLNSDVIQPMEISTKAQSVAFLDDKKESSTNRGGRWSNNACSQ